MLQDDEGSKNKSDCGPEGHHPTAICLDQKDMFECAKHWHCDEGQSPLVLKVKCDWPYKINCTSVISAIITFFDIELLMRSELSILNSQLALIKVFYGNFR